MLEKPLAGGSKGRHKDVMAAYQLKNIMNFDLTNFLSLPSKQNAKTTSVQPMARQSRLQWRFHFGLAQQGDRYHHPANLHWPFHLQNLHHSTSLLIIQKPGIDLKVKRVPFIN